MWLLTSTLDSFITPKYLLGKPIDTWFDCRLFNYVPWLLGFFIKMQMPQTRSFDPINTNFSKIASTRPGLGTELIEHFGSGKVKRVGSIKSFTSESITFSDGTTLSPDVFVVCTGYTFEIPFLKKLNNVIQVHPYKLTPLYKHLVSIEEPTLAFLCIPVQQARPWPLAEIQSMWMARLLTGNIALPSKEEMKKYESQIEVVLKNTNSKPSKWHRVDHLNYVDDLAEEAGCYPHLLKWSNSDLFFKLFFGSALPCHYRLQGPYSKPEYARETIKQVRI